MITLAEPDTESQVATDQPTHFCPCCTDSYYFAAGVCDDCPTPLLPIPTTTER